jgi:hypothetical protein
MDYDKDKVDEMALALLFLTIHDGCRAWKGHDFGVMNRLHEKGLISDPVGKAKSVVLTEEGLERCRELFMKHFATPGERRAPNENSSATAEGGADAAAGLQEQHR